VFVIMVASECSPVAQAGGLGDVVLGLSRELERRGHAVEIVLPHYDCLRHDRIKGMTIAYEGLDVPWYSGAVSCTVWSGLVEGRRCYFIEPHSGDRFFQRGHLYGSKDDIARFAFFSKAAMEFMYKAGKRPDVIHCHDWETALVPVLLYEIYQPIGMHDQRVCFTIHNFRHQGIAPEWVLHATGLPPGRLLDPTRLRHDGRPDTVNLLKAGIVYSNAVTTVSPQHAREARHGREGWGMAPTLEVHAGKFSGILNGLDSETWDPEADPCIPQPYSADSLDGKALNKRGLRERLQLANGHRPLVAYVGRLDGQKGIHLIHHAVLYTLALGGQAVVLGASPDPAIAARLERLKAQLAGNRDVHLELEFGQDLAHLVYAGADVLVMPSLFEPCGLVQQIGLAYGTVPVVRATGGLIDTVHDRDYSDRVPEERNGFVFRNTDPEALESALSRAMALWHRDPEGFRELMRNGMRPDRSWTAPARHYLDIYEHIRQR
jgi:starch synthase